MNEKQVEKIRREVEAIYESNKPFNFGKRIAAEIIDEKGVSYVPDMPENAIGICKALGWKMKEFRRGWNSVIMPIFS
jgi:hypothetical protein